MSAELQKEQINWESSMRLKRGTLSSDFLRIGIGLEKLQDICGMSKWLKMPMLL